MMRCKLPKWDKSMRKSFSTFSNDTAAPAIYTRRA